MSAFKDEEIDGRALLELKDEDLKELGIKKMGQRKRILQVTNSRGSPGQHLISHGFLPQ